MKRSKIARVLRIESGMTFRVKDPKTAISRFKDLGSHSLLIHTRTLRFFLFLLAPLTALCSAADTPAKPNIVLIISDQHAADAMRCAGYAHVKTPALDALAATGVRFANTYCTYPVCMSSRASLMTGRWPHELKGAGEDAEDSAERPARAKGKKGGKQSGNGSNPPGKSLGTLMKEAGYQTAYFGKWHVGGVSPSPENRWHGFDTLVDGRRDEDAAGVTEGGSSIDKVQGVKFLRLDNNAAVYAVGSGAYRFQSALSGNVKGESK